MQSDLVNPNVFKSNTVIDEGNAADLLGWLRHTSGSGYWAFVTKKVPRRTSLALVSLLITKASWWWATWAAGLSTIDTSPWLNCAEIEAEMGFLLQVASLVMCMLSGFHSWRIKPRTAKNSGKVFILYPSHYFSQ